MAYERLRYTGETSDGETKISERGAARRASDDAIREKRVMARRKFPSVARRGAAYERRRYTGETSDGELKISERGAARRGLRATTLYGRNE